VRPFDSLTFHPTSEKIVNILCQLTQNNSLEFFRLLLCYHLAKIAATMRVKIATKDRGEIPVNLYALNLATSGHGKGHSTNIIEEQLTHHFQTRFESETLPIVTEVSLSRLASRRANIIGEDEAVELELVKTEFYALGKLAFSFDSGTPAAIKQMRHKLLMCEIGAMNLEIDEIGSNLLGNGEALNTYLELYDVGKIKQKLTKNTKENTRNEEISGRTPANLLAFGTPDKLFDGGKVEDELYSFLDTGYARRLFFGFSKGTKKKKNKTAEEIYDALTDTNVSSYLSEIAMEFGDLADVINHGKVITVSKKVSILIIDYRLHCDRLADSLGEHQGMAKAELKHRYFKALKLAGVFAFIDNESEVSEDNYYHAIAMAEESGRAFEKILSRDRPYVKLAKYLGSIEHEVTHVDLSEDLPFFRGSAAAKQEFIQLASAWGYKNHTVIKRTYTNGIEFLSGETLKHVDLDHIRVSYSKDISDNYQNVKTPWTAIHNLTQQPLKHWISHHSINGHRSEEDVVAGFDIIVLDVDEGTTIQTAKAFLKDYKYLLYTTKRHTNQNHRFRLILPLNYQMNLTAPDFRDFMKNVFEWVPFEVDTQTCQRSRKWLTHKGNCLYGKGDKLLDARLFIPKTAKNDEQKKFIATYQSMTNMERWFISNSINGNRNNQLARYALMMVDLGYAIEDIRDNVIGMNDKLPDKLKEREIDATIMLSVTKKIAKRDQP